MKIAASSHCSLVLHFLRFSLVFPVLLLRGNEQKFRIHKTHLLLNVATHRGTERASDGNFPRRDSSRNTQSAYNITRTTNKPNAQ